LEAKFGVISGQYCHEELVEGEVFVEIGIIGLEECMAVIGWYRSTVVMEELLYV
jgi:hypothetical protein